MVPFKCVIHRDVRTIPPQTREVGVADVERILGTLSRANKDLDATVEVAYKAADPFILVDSPIVKEVQHNLSRLSGPALIWTQV